MTAVKRDYHPKAYYLFALGIVALLALTSYVALRNITASQDTAARLINISGRQRMLSQRIALLAFTLANTASVDERAALRPELQRSITEMTDAHQALISGKLDGNLVNIPSDAVHAMYFAPPMNTDAQVLSYLSLANIVLAMPDSTLNTSTSELQTLLAQSPTLLQSLDAIVSQYEIDKKNEVSNLERVEFTILLVTLGVLVLVTFLIFRPMELRIKARETQLQHEIDERKKIEAALRYSETAYRLVVNNMPDTAIVSFDTNLRFTLAEGPFLSLAGYDRNLMLGKTLQEVVPAASYEMLRPLYESTLKGEIMTLERDRGDLAYHAQFVPIRTETGDIVGGMVISLDITRRKRAEDALRVSEQRFRELAAHAPIGIFQLDDQNEFRFVNPRWSQITGLAQEDAKIEKIGAIVHPDDREAIIKLWLDKNESHTELIREIRLLKPDGQIVWVYTSLASIVDANGNASGYIGTITDISQLKKIEETLQESRDFVTSITEATPDLIYVFDTLQQRLVYTNHNLASFLNYSAEAFDMNDPDLVAKMMHPDDYQTVFVPNLRQTSAGDADEEIQYRLRSGQGEWRWYYGHTRVLKRGENGAPTQLIGLCHDITERKLAEQKNLELELERGSVDMLSNFIKNTSHELRTPLTMITTSAYLMSRMDDGDKRKTRLEAINNEVSHLTRMIDDFQTMAALDSNSAIKRDIIDLNELVYKVAFDVNANVREKHITFNSRTETNLPPIEGDSKQLQTAVKQLLDNAIRYTPPEGIISIYTHLADVGDNHEAIIRICDSGIGISPKDLLHIFKPLYKANEARTRDGSGSGIGLPIVQKIIELHHGTITVESEVGKGSTFTMCFPVPEN